MQFPGLCWCPPRPQPPTWRCKSHRSLARCPPATGTGCGNLNLEGSSWPWMTHDDRPGGGRAAAPPEWPGDLPLWLLSAQAAARAASAGRRPRPRHLPVYNYNFLCFVLGLKLKGFCCRWSNGIDYGTLMGWVCMIGVSIQVYACCMVYLYFCCFGCWLLFICRLISMCHGQHLVRSLWDSKCTKYLIGGWSCS